MKNEAEFRKIIADRIKLIGRLKKDTKDKLVDHVIGGRYQAVSDWVYLSVSGGFSDGQAVLDVLPDFWANEIFKS